MRDVNSTTARIRIPMEQFGRYLRTGMWTRPDEGFEVNSILGMIREQGVSLSRAAVAGPVAAEAQPAHGKVAVLPAEAAGRLMAAEPAAVGVLRPPAQKPRLRPLARRQPLRLCASQPRLARTAPRGIMSSVMVIPT